MDKWIEEIEAAAMTQNSYADGDLLASMKDGEVDISYKVDWNNGKHILLKGLFTIKQLQSLITHMKKYAKEEE